MSLPNIIPNLYKVSNGILTINIAGTISKTQYGVISFVSNMDISKTTLVVNLINGFIPKKGDKFEILQSKRLIIGEFVFRNLPTVVQWKHYKTTVNYIQKYILEVI